MLGKLPLKQLKQILEIINGYDDDSVYLKSGIGEDAGIIDTSKIKGFNGLMLVTADPITAATTKAGQIAIMINANDIAVSGGVPLYATLTVLMPKGATFDSVKEIMTDAKRSADNLGIRIIGGHTEFTDAVTRPVISCSMIGKQDSYPLKTSTAKAGEYIFVTDYIALEGTCIIANDYADRLVVAGKSANGSAGSKLGGSVNNNAGGSCNTFTKKEIEQAASLIDKICILDNCKTIIGLIKKNEIALTTLHDITEGGVVGAIAELCASSGVGAKVNLDEMPLLAITKRICEHLNLNPYKLISSGALLFTAKDKDSIISKLTKHGIKVAVVGQITEKDLVFYKGGKTLALGLEGDEISKL
ncbi:MAG: AIR synthase-related protein [Firmicutes bacterium]|nr:AIR synthase-related protein [Bacillota bacterium]